jgi:hypothetical protein
MVTVLTSLEFGHLGMVMKFAELIGQLLRAQVNYMFDLPKRRVA